MNAADAAALRIVYFGTPQFAVPSLATLIASRHPVVGVVTQPDRPRGRGQRLQPGPVKVLALEQGLPVFQPDRLHDAPVADTLAAWAPDLGVVAAYGKLIPEHLLALPRLGMINVHASLLPAYRGAAPVHRAVIAGDAETGVTIMRVVKALDAGGMFARVRRPIGPDETSDVVERGLATAGAALLLEVVEALARGDADDEPQDAARATYAARLTKAEGLIDWRAAALTIHNRVRGLYPWPHAFTYLGAERLIVLRTRPLGARTDTVPPGTITASDREGVVVATGDGQQLAILEVQPEGRRAMPVRDFLAGHPIAPGTRFDERP